jgi:hypothetical protein
MASPTTIAKSPLTAESAVEFKGDRDVSLVSLHETAQAPAGTPALVGFGQAQNKESATPVARGDQTSQRGIDSSDVRTASQDVARRARDAFRDACETKDRDSSESSYVAMRASLGELWAHAKNRDRPFRDLLAMLDAATRHVELDAFSQSQKDVLRSAFQDLPKWLLTDEEVMENIQKFAEFGIDITGPIRQTTRKRLRITVEEVD